MEEDEEEVLILKLQVEPRRLSLTEYKYAYIQSEGGGTRKQLRR